MLHDPRKNPGSLSAKQLDSLRQAIAEERESMPQNRTAARKVSSLLRERQRASLALVVQLRDARVAKSISLDEMEARTGIRKSAISRFENSKNPNPTLATLQRYAEAIGMRLDVSLTQIVSD